MKTLALIRQSAAALLLLFASLVATLPCIPAAAAQEVVAPDQGSQRFGNGLAATPPMGWNSWNKFGCNVNETVIRDTADAMATNGMREAGYRYVVIDDCWHGPRDANGFITADPVRFPSGIRALSDYVHARGLQFGIYSDAGAKTCGGRPGSQGHEYQDALQYARWGVDYLKYDWCSTGPRNAEEAYALMADALKGSGRPILLSMCEWGTAKPWLWASRIGNLWRTTSDITDKWTGKHDYSLGVAAIADLNEPLWPYAGPGHWNDPDMLEVGNGGMSDAEYRSHFSLWAMMAAPLIAGNDVARMTPSTREILLNRDVIAVDQDAAGIQGHRVWKDGDREVWMKPLADGGRAVLLWNRSEASVPIAADWSMLGYPASLRLRVRDLWTHRDQGQISGRYLATVPAHGVVMVTMRA
ncbi:glycoside hydrolase family 27 protein [Sphingomonas ginkgonis]|uniref:Alpha-galactosidase n=1 Tax=Sphingomonas ginkgonis TaxID=2315330 RepID=A0A429V9L5_9SPHN|nr:glycoside hydrolase family 27 protein [Sphingomonas ginkgonis]RST30615.1 glycoside hydrolase family 27 protein [Sphingomonas ginkgonis]